MLQSDDNKNISLLGCASLIIAFKHISLLDIFSFVMVQEKNDRSILRTSSIFHIPENFFVSIIWGLGRAAWTNAWEMKQWEQEAETNLTAFHC